MDIKTKNIKTKGIRFSLVIDGKEIARAYLYLMRNNLHEEPFGLMEDVYVESSSRGKSLGKQLVLKVIEEAKKQSCYKLICTSRHSKPHVHKLYKKIGFENHGIEFRMNF